MHKINISVENYKTISNLCKQLGIDSAIYDKTSKNLAGKLIMDLSHILIFKKSLLQSGAIQAPDPANYQRGGKYDI